MRPAQTLTFDKDKMIYTMISFLVSVFNLKIHSKIPVTCQVSQ